MRSMNGPSHAGGALPTTDPVCGMTVDPKTAEHATHGGVTYYFCSSGCRETFEKNPERYLAGSHPHH